MPATSIEKLPTALIYTHSLLEGSMTFIKSQAESLERYRAIYVGAHRVDGIDLPANRALTVNNGSKLGFVSEALFRRFGFAPGFIKRLSSYEPKLVHAHFGTCGPAGLALSESLGAPLIVTFHGQDATMADKEHAKTIRGKELLRKKSRMIMGTSTIIAVSEYIRNALLSKGYPDEKIVVLRNGIDVEFFRPSYRLEHENIILFVGRFVEKKGIRYLLEAARRLKTSGVSFELVLVGTGPLEDSLKKAAEKTGIKCTFAGFLPVDEVKKWIERARVVAVPSVVARDGDSEGLPTILLEAQAMETPLVATRHSGIPEGLIEDETAFLVDEKDVDALAIGLRNFLESPDLASQFGKAGRQFVINNFDMHNQVSKLQDIYDSARRPFQHSA
jgi:glycosyltransferase involved in cell wall biosynthesis